MRIIIDTEMQAIIVPDTFYQQVNKLNDIITEAGGRKLEYNDYIRTCFEKAYNGKLMTASELTALRGGKRRRGREHMEDDEMPTLLQFGARRK